MLSDRILFSDAEVIVLDKPAGVPVTQPKRGGACLEDRLGELSQSISPRLSSPRMVENEVHLLLALLAHNLLSILRGELEKGLGSGWDVGRVQRTVLKTAVRVTRAGRRLIVDTALSAVPLWSCLLQRISKWILPTTKQPVPQRRRRQWVAPPRHAFLVPVLRQ